MATASNPDGASQGGGPQMAAITVVPPTINTKEFYGEASKDKDYSVTSYINHVNKAASLNKWTDAQTVDYATSYLRGSAAQFVTKLSLTPKDADDVKLWSTLRPRLTARYRGDGDGMAESANILKTLKMKSEETFTDFADRCEIAKRRMDLSLDDEYKESAGYETIFERDTVAYFVNGIPEKIREFLFNHHKDKGLEDLARLATDYSANAKTRGVKFEANTDAIETTEPDEIRAIQMEALNAQIDTWAAGSRAKPFSFNPPKFGKGNKGRAGAQNYNPSGQPTKPRWVNSEAAWKQIQAFRGYQAGRILCFKCWAFGDHYANNCVNPPRQRPAELNLVEPPQRRNRGPPQNQNTNINPVETENPQTPDTNGALISAIQGMQGQMGTMATMMANMMRAGSDTESQPDRPATPYSGYGNLNF